MLRAALLVLWVVFVPAWLLAVHCGAQPSVAPIVLSFVIWGGAFGGGWLILRRERCPVCGERLLPPDVFEALRATECASCARGLVSPRSSRAPQPSPAKAGSSGAALSSKRTGGGMP